MGDSRNRAAEIVRPLIRVRQVREFLDVPITAAEMDAIADAARWSGSSQNSQPWRLITIRCADTIRRIAEALPPNARALRTAPAAVAVVLPDEQGHAVSHAYDEGRLTERILIAATFLGLGEGVSWVPTENRPAIGEILGVPAGRFIRTIVAIGHPTEDAKKPKDALGQARLPRSEVVLEERWPKT